MKKLFLTITGLLFVALAMTAQNKAGLLIGYDTTGDIESASEKNAAVWFQQTYADGLTVEVWNYYNAYAVSRGRDELKQMLDRSTISFTTAPGRYVNAFARLGEAKNPLDCTVTPPEGWTGTAADGTWNYNVTYRKE